MKTPYIYKTTPQLSDSLLIYDRPNESIDFRLQVLKTTYQTIWDVMIAEYHVVDYLFNCLWLNKENEDVLRNARERLNSVYLQASEKISKKNPENCIKIELEDETKEDK